MKLFLLGSCICFALVVSGQNSNQLLNTPVYSIQPPQGWTVDTTKSLGAELFLFSPLENSNDKFRDNINLLIQNISAYNLGLDDYVKISEQQIQSEMVKDGVLLSSERMHKNGRDFQKMIYTMTQDVFQLKILQYAFIVNGKAYVLTFTAEASVFDNYRNLVSETMNSFTIKL